MLDSFFLCAFHVHQFSLGLSVPIFLPFPFIFRTPCIFLHLLLSLCSYHYCYYYCFSCLLPRCKHLSSSHWGSFVPWRSFLQLVVIRASTSSLSDSSRALFFLVLFLAYNLWFYVFLVLCFYAFFSSSLYSICAFAFPQRLHHVRVCSSFPCSCFSCFVSSPSKVFEF